MAFSLKNIIFNLYGNYIQSNDSYKNIEGKGILQRYNELVAEDYDTHSGLDIRNLLDKIYVPATVKSELIPYLQDMLGVGIYLSNSDDIKRKVIRYGNKINNLKGTRQGFEILFKFLGFTSVVIVEHPAGGSFDDGNIDYSYTPLTFDEDVRTFDTSCPTCSDITVLLYGTITLTDDILKAVYKVVAYNKPIDVRIRGLIYYNDIPLPPEDSILIFIDGNGDLIYDNFGAPLTEFSLSDSGDLIVTGNNEGSYTIDENGNLIFE